MKIFNVQRIHSFLRVTDKPIILVSILLIISLTCIGATRFRVKRQQWALKANDHNLKVQYDTTTDTSNMASAAEEKNEHILENESEGRAEYMTKKQNSVGHSCLGNVGKAGRCRDVSGILTNGTDGRMDTPPADANIPGIFSGAEDGQFDKPYLGCLGVATETGGDETEKLQSKEQESARTGTATEIFEGQFSEMGTYLTELLGERGTIN
jgi:hypothetical protein